MHPGVRHRSALPPSLAAAACGWLLAAACPSPDLAPAGAPVAHERAGLGCASDAECGLDRCDPATFPGGACVGACTSAGGCAVPDAGPAQVCLGDLASGVCLRGCEADGGCLRQGWICQPSARGHLCLPDCRSAPQSCGDGGSGLECSTLSGRCEAPLPADAGAFGLCGVTSSCAGAGDCVSLDGQAGDGGVCTFPCDPSQADAGCPAGSDCLLRKRVADGGSEGRCAVFCASAGSSSGCVPGTTCQALPAGTRSDGGPRTQDLCAP